MGAPPPSAGMFHCGDYSIPQAKRYLTDRGLPIRPRETPRPEQFLCPRAGSCSMKEMVTLCLLS